MPKSSTYLLNAALKKKYRNVGEVRISTWGVVPEELDALIATGFWGDTHAQVYYRLAMTKLIELSEPPEK